MWGWSGQAFQGRGRGVGRRAGGQRGRECGQSGREAQCSRRTCAGLLAGVVTGDSASWMSTVTERRAGGTHEARDALLDRECGGAGAASQKAEEARVRGCHRGRRRGFPREQARGSEAWNEGPLRACRRRGSCSVRSVPGFCLEPHTAGTGEPPARTVHCSAVTGLCSCVTVPGLHEALSVCAGPLSAHSLLSGGSAMPCT